MTAHDLEAVCERHRISVVELCGGFYAAQGETIGEWTADTLADAVAALLKARWGISAARVDSGPDEHRWSACYLREVLPWTSGPTELAAVVALADRLGGFA